MEKKNKLSINLHSTKHLFHPRGVTSSAPKLRISPAEVEFVMNSELQL